MSFKPIKEGSYLVVGKYETVRKDYVFSSAGSKDDDLGNVIWGQRLTTTNLLSTVHIETSASTYA